MAMRRVILFSILIFFSSTAPAQWRKIADLPGHAYGTSADEPVTCVYFLDLPGPPRIGFAGTEVGLWKTTDGGGTWAKIWNEPFSVTGMTFKDSLTGWFSVFSSSGYLAGTGCYKTTDGGNSWNAIAIPGTIFGSNAIYYRSNSNTLFLSTDSGMLSSVDLGNHWKWLTNMATGGISFFDDSNGIAAAYPDAFIDTSTWLVRTTDGGLTWDSVIAPYSHEPLTIPGTSISFSCDAGQTIISRSDDFGKTWMKIYDFVSMQDSHWNDIAPYGDGMIGGSLAHLYILTDWGMYVSTDEGVNWNLEPGSPAYSPDGQGGQTFYCANGVTIAGASTTAPVLYQGEGLWKKPGRNRAFRRRHQTLPSPPAPLPIPPRDR